MTRRIVGVLAVAALAAAAPFLGAQDPGTSVEVLFKEFASDRTPGCATGAVRDGRPLLAKAYGMADLEHGVVLTTQSAFYMASVSKQFMALAILLLSRKGSCGSTIPFDSTFRSSPSTPRGLPCVTSCITRAVCATI